MITRIIFWFAVASSVLPKLNKTKGDLAEQAAQTYYESLARARVLRDSLSRGTRPMFDVENMFFMRNNRVFEFQWKGDRFIRVPRPLNHSLSKFLTQKPRESASGKRIGKTDTYLLAPLYNRFRRMRNHFKQMECSLAFKIMPLQHYVEFGVVLLRLEIRSSCLPGEFVKFLWANSFEKASHMLLILKGQKFPIMFDRPKPRRTTDRGLVFQYTLMKLPRPFRAKVYTPLNIMRTAARLASRQGSKKGLISKKPKRSRRMFLPKLKFPFFQKQRSKPQRIRYKNKREQFLSFNQLLEQNPLQSVQVDLPIKKGLDGIPYVPWKDPGEDFEIFMNGDRSWTVAEIRQIIAGPNPLLCRTRAIPRLKDSQIICSL